MGKPNVTRQTLEATPPRAFKFLQGAGTNTYIRAVLKKAGYTAKEHELGWSLLHAVGGYEPVASPAPAPGGAANPAVQEAVEKLDAADEELFRRSHAALGRHYPAQEEFLFREDLKAATGYAAVVSMETFLDRLGQLESGDERKATRKEDHAAIALLKERDIIDKERRENYRALVNTAKKANENAVLPNEEAQAKSREVRLQALVDLYTWYSDWSETARAVLKKRIYQIQLGLAKRRRKGEDDSDDETGDETEDSLVADGAPSK